jgi:ribosomal protein L14E/L6E/L27E
VVLFTAGEHATKLAVIVEIIDHKRVRLLLENYLDELEAYWRNARGKVQELEVNMNTPGPR